jgi:magnesium transporter
MPRFIKKSEKDIGASPGTVIVAEELERPDPAISLVSFDGNEIHEAVLSNIDEARPWMERSATTWVNISSLPRAEIFKAVGRVFGLDPLTLEDIANTGHRPKMEEFDNYLFLTLKGLSYDAVAPKIISRQVSLILGKGYILSIQETPGDVYENIRKRLRKDRSRIRNSGSGYLMYALFDALIDHYYAVMTEVGEDIETLEGTILEDPAQDTLNRIHALKREMLYMRKQVRPVGEALSHILKEPPSFIQEVGTVHISDTYDHLINILEAIDSYRDLLITMQDLYMSMVNNRMNEVMKVLTIIATIFIPLTFIAGIYGMNFKFMPELDLKYGYFGVLGFMAAVALGLVVYCKRKKWF